MTTDSAVWRILGARMIVLRAVVTNSGDTGLTVEQAALATGYTASAADCFLRGCRMAHEAEYDAATGRWRATAHGHETLRRAESEDTPCPFPLKES